MKIYEFDKLPVDFLKVKTTELHNILPGPSIIYLPGELEQPLFISTLLHGNETTGFNALQKLLIEYPPNKQKLPRSLIIFIGNVHAAQHNVRRLAEQADYNRVWRHGDTIEHQMAQQVIAIAKERQPFACIDIHNNTGRNPYHACISTLSDSCVYLGSLFYKQVVYFVRPYDALTNVFSQFCPATAIECSKSDNPGAASYALDYLEKCMRLTSLDEKPHSSVEIFHSIIRIKVPKDAEISFTNTPDKTVSGFQFISDLDTLNFKTLPVGTLLGWRNHSNHTLSVTDENNQEVGEHFLSYDNNEIRTKKIITPSMLTQDISVIHLDCLGYFMEKISKN